MEVEYYGSDGRRFGAIRANAHGINTLTIPVRGVSLLVVRAVENEPAGFAIDNVVIGVAPPAFKPTRMVAIGDSYTSGEGLVPGDGIQYDCGTDLHKATYFENTNARPVGFFAVPEGRSNLCETVTQGPVPADFDDRPLRTYENLCHRHEQAWPNDIRKLLGVAPSNGLFVACSGALTKHLGFLDSGNGVQYPQSPQGVAGGETQKKNAEDFTRAPAAPVDFVTVGVGGNDAGFEAIIRDCLFHACLNHFIAHYTDGMGNVTFSNPAPNPSLRPPARPITHVFGALNASPFGPCGPLCAQPACAPAFCELGVRADNFSPLTQLNLTLNCDPVFLGRIVTDASGFAQGTFTIPQSVPDGEHLLEIEGRSPNGVVQIGSQRVIIKRLEPARPLVEPPPCSRTVTGDATGPFSAGAGEHLCIDKARVIGPVSVGAGGSLTVTGSQVTGGLIANAAAFLKLCNASLSRPGLSVTGATQRLVIGDPANGCAGNRAIGTSIAGNTAGATLP